MTYARFRIHAKNRRDAEKAMPLLFCGLARPPESGIACLQKERHTIAENVEEKQLEALLPLRLGG